MDKKRIGMALGAALIILLVICVQGAQNRKSVHGGAHVIANILSVDAERNEAAVTDSGAAGIFGDQCIVDLTGASLIYCDYQTGEVREISLMDLSAGDEAIVQIDASEIQNAMKGRAKIRQLQLSTQRLAE